MSGFDDNPFGEPTVDNPFAVSHRLSSQDGPNILLQAMKLRVVVQLHDMEITNKFSLTISLVLFAIVGYNCL